VTAASNKRITERFIIEFPTTGDAALAEEFLSPDIAMHLAGQQQRARDTYPALVAQCMAFYRLADGKIVEARARLDMPHTDAVVRSPTPCEVGAAAAYRGAVIVGAESQRKRIVRRRARYLSRWTSITGATTISGRTD
jgi:hypothetical protein